MFTPRTEVIKRAISILKIQAAAILDAPQLGYPQTSFAFFLDCPLHAGD